MSSQPALRPAPLALLAHRVVESQSQISTMKLVDSLEDQALLEGLLDAAKPPAFPGTEGLHYLLSTPFRYPPLRYGSRFGRPHEHGYWYGSVELETALAEVAFYLLRFREDAGGALAPTQLRRTCFHAPLETERGVDLTAPAWAGLQAGLSDPLSYAVTQPLGSAMVAAEVALALWTSARRPPGRNVVVFDPSAFAGPPDGLHEWVLWVQDSGVSARPALGGGPALRFPREMFLVDGRLPQVG